MGNSLQNNRAIKVSKPNRRVSKEELSSLKEAFSRIHDGQVTTSH